MPEAPHSLPRLLSRRPPPLSPPCQGLGRARRLDDAFEVLEAMESGTAPGRPALTAVHLNTLVNACADAGDARRARSVLQRYRSAAVGGTAAPTAFTYNLLIKVTQW